MRKLKGSTSKLIKTLHDRRHAGIYLLGVSVALSAAMLKPCDEEALTAAMERMGSGCDGLLAISKRGTTALIRHESGVFYIKRFKIHQAWPVEAQETSCQP